MRVLIIGAGPVGCLAARIFSSHGHDVRVFEKRPDFRRYPAAHRGGRTIGLSLSPRGSNALVQLGCGAAVRPLTLPMDRRVIHNANGQTTETAYGPGRRNHAISREQLNAAMLQQLDPYTQIQFGFACKEIDFENRVVLLSSGTGAMRHEQYDLLIGADGAFSVVRDRLEQAGALSVTRQLLPSAYQELTLRQSPALPTLCETAIHIWPRRGFFLVALPKGGGRFTGTLVMHESGTPGFNQVQSSSALAQLLHEHFPGATGHFARIEQDFSEHPVSRIMTATCSRLHYCDSALLIGDAAHAIAPFLGQGINLAFEDCAVLDTLLRQHSGRLATVLENYSENRTRNGTAAAELSMNNYRELTHSGDTPEPAAPPRPPEHGMPIVTAVNFLGLDYADVLHHVKNHAVIAAAAS